MRNDIPMIDFRDEINFLWTDLNNAIQQVLLSGEFIMGQQVELLERDLAEYLGVRHAISLNSGTDALVIGLRILGVGKEDEVITTSFTFFATAEAIGILGAVPVFVDIDPQTFNLDPNQVEEKITPRTKVIIPVHLFGQAASIDQIMSIANNHNLYVLEDVAQSFGGTFHSQKLGTIGQLGAFSFFPSKNLGAYGDGGLLVTNDDAMAEMARMLRVHGSKTKYRNEILGYNSRLDALQAAILRVKLPHVDTWNKSRQQVAKYYNNLLGSLADIIPPFAHSPEEHVYHQYTIRVLNRKRNILKAALNQAGIGAMVYYPVPIHRLPVYAHMNLSLSCTDQIAEEVLSLPIWPYIRKEQQDRVFNVIAENIARPS